MSSQGILLMVPVLPSGARIAPFIAEIDQSHKYSNFGPLNRRFQDELAAFLETYLCRAARVHVSTVASGTVALELALRARARGERNKVIIPSYTFVATAHAAVNAGLEPHFVDIDEHSLALTPEIAEAAIREGVEAAAVVPVSPFGAPVDVTAWERFEDRTTVPVVLDLAAAATSIRHVGTLPICLSLHSTKMLSLGEGGAVISADADCIDRITRMTSFGFEPHEPVSTLRGGNYRVSEYAAAVGLASIQDLERKSAALAERARQYRLQLQGLKVSLQRGFGVNWLATTMNVFLPPARVEHTLDLFDRHAIQWRRWYGLGCHTHPVFADCSRSDLANTERDANRVIGVPFHELLTAEDIALVCSALREALA